MDKIILKHSVVKEKKPLATQIEYGELAVNYNSGHTFVSTLDNSGTVRTISTDDYIMAQVADKGYLTSSALTNYYTKAESDSTFMTHTSTQNLINDAISLLPESNIELIIITDNKGSDTTTGLYGLDVGTERKMLFDRFDAEQMVNVHNNNDYAKYVITHYDVYYAISVNGKYVLSKLDSVEQETNGDVIFTFDFDDKARRITLTKQFANARVDTYNYATQEWVEGKNYLTSSALTNYYTKAETDSAITQAITSAITSGVTVDAYTKAEADAKFAKNSDIPSLDGYATQEWVESKNYLTQHQDLSAYATKTAVNGMFDYNNTTGILTITTL